MTNGYGDAYSVSHINTATNGWYCTGCGSWIPYGVSHSCSKTVPAVPSYPQPAYPFWLMQSPYPYIYQPIIQFPNHKELEDRITELEKKVRKLEGGK